MSDPITPEEALEFTEDMLPDFGNVGIVLAQFMPQIAAVMVAMDKAAESDCQCSPCESFRVIKKSLQGMQ